MGAKSLRKDEQIIWYEAPGKGPKWARRTAVSQGVVFVPGAIAGRNEMNVLLCAGWDNTSAVIDGKHAYYPSDWMKREFPECKDIVELIEHRVKEAMG